MRDAEQHVRHLRLIMSLAQPLPAIRKMQSHCGPCCISIPTCDRLINVRMFASQSCLVLLWIAVSQQRRVKARSRHRNYWLPARPCESNQVRKERVRNRPEIWVALLLAMRVRLHAAVWQQKVLIDLVSG